MDVAKSAPQYLKWLVKNDVHDRRPELTLALESLGFLSNHNISTLGEPLLDEFPDSDENAARATQQRRKGLPAEPGSYVMTFGKHKGKRLEDIPTKYLDWLSSSGTIRKHPMLAVHLQKHLSART